jgi:hypothetical protein
MKGVRRFCVAVLVSLSVVLPATAAFAQTDTAPPAAEQTATTDTAGESDLSCSKPGVVRPNCGTKPQQAGDRGGALQYTVWGVLIAGLAVVFTVIFRSAAKTNRRKTTEAGNKDWN